jgi:hypothetical protein
VYGLTRDLDYKYNAPEIVAGGIAVDLDAAARRQHEAAMGEPAPPPLVQIAPAEPAIPIQESRPDLSAGPYESREPTSGTTRPIAGNESQ